MVTFAVSHSQTHLAVKATPKTCKFLVQLCDLVSRQLYALAGRIQHFDGHRARSFRLWHRKSARIDVAIGGLHHKELATLQVIYFEPVDRNRPKSIVQAD